MRNLLAAGLVAFAVSSVNGLAATPQPIHDPPMTAILLDHITNLENRVYRLEQFNTCISKRIVWSSENQPLVKWTRKCAGL